MLRGSMPQVIGFMWVSCSSNPERWTSETLICSHLGFLAPSSPRFGAGLLERLVLKKESKTYVESIWLVNNRVAPTWVALVNGNLD